MWTAPFIPSALLAAKTESIFLPFRPISLANTARFALRTLAGKATGQSTKEIWIGGCCAHAAASPTLSASKRFRVSGIVAMSSCTDWMAVAMQSAGFSIIGVVLKQWESMLPF